jgi:hypothetical protein
MRLPSLALLASLSVAGFVGCGVGPVSVAQPVESGRQIMLKAGQSALLAASADLRIGFDGVLADSRCPKGEQCLRAGEAIVKVWLQRGAGPRQVLELVGPVAEPQGQATLPRAMGHQLVFIRLEPYPVSGRAMLPAAHVLTLSVQPAAAQESAQ